MTPQRLHTELRRELERLEQIAEEIQALHDDVGEESPTMREKAAAGAFLASFYMGIENVLKRICRYYDLEMPRSERWHVEIFERFTDPPMDSLPVLFGESLTPQMDAYRRFRHVVHHGYEFELSWDRMREGLQRAKPVFERFQTRVEGFLDRLDS